MHSVRLDSSSPVICFMSREPKGCWNVWPCHGCHIYLSWKKIQYIYMCATNYKTRWFLTLVTAWKHCILSLSPSIERTPSRKHTVCAVTFLKTHCPWANDGRENCCLNIYSTPEMSSSHTQKIPLPDSVFTTNVATKVLQLLCSIFVSATNLLTL